MWILESLDEKNNLAVLQSYCLRNDCSITIGRSLDGDIVFPTDRSISRKHAQIKLQSNGVFLIDLKSTLGTFLNGNRVPPQEMISLSSRGNLIKLGNEHTTIRISEVSYKFCPTRLEKLEKDKLKSIVKFIGGEIVKQVETCSHVLCNRFSATVKTLTAIVLQKPIISLHWVESFANPTTSTSNAILIPDVKEFYPPGTSELTSIEKLPLSRSHLLQDCVVFFLFANDNQYELILESGGAVIISLIGIDSIDELIKVSKEKLTSLRGGSRSHPCVFYDEARPLDTKTIHLMKRLNIPFLGSGDLATAIFSMSPPQFVTHELLSQRVSSQQSQVQASQAVEIPIPRTTVAQNTGIVRSTTLVQTERAEVHSLGDDHQEKEEQRRTNELKRQELERLENEKRRRALEKQTAAAAAAAAELERAKEAKRREQEQVQFERREKEKRDELKRQLELEKIERERREKIEMDKRQQEEDRIRKEKREATKANASNRDGKSSRSKRSAEVLQDYPSAVAAPTAESSPLKRRRPPPPENLPSPTSSSLSSSSNVLFEDQPLVEIEHASAPTAAQLQPPQSSRSLVDSDGWVSIDKSLTGSNCIVMTSNSNSAMGPPVSVPRRTAINFDDPNSSSSSQARSHDRALTEFPQAVVVEMKFRMKSGSATSSNSGSGQATRHPRDQRCFKKNVVRTILNSVNGSNATSSSSVNNFILKKRDMDKVLPKESERELLLNQTYESERRSLENRETLFTDGMTGAAGSRGRKPRFGS